MHGQEFDEEEASKDPKSWRNAIRPTSRTVAVTVAAILAYEAYRSAEHTLIVKESMDVTKGAVNVHIVDGNIHHIFDTKDPPKAMFCNQVYADVYAKFYCRRCSAMYREYVRSGHIELGDTGISDRVESKISAILDTQKLDSIYAEYRARVKNISDKEWNDMAPNTKADIFSRIVRAHWSIDDIKPEEIAKEYVSRERSVPYGIRDSR